MTLSSRGRRVLHLSAFFLFAVSLFMLASCSSTQIAGLQGAEEEKEIPDELFEKFKIEDAASARKPVEEEPSSQPEPMDVEVAEAPQLSKSDSNNAPSLPAKKKEPKPKKKKKKKVQSKPKEKPKPKFAYPNRRPPQSPFWLAERLTYEITYFGVVAGILTVEVSPFKSVNDRRVYHLKGHIRSSRISSLFYRLNDTVESFFDFDGLFSHRFHLVLDESKQQRNSLELYDSEKRQAYFWDRWNHHKKGYREKKEFHTIPSFPQDVLSSLYYVRAFDLSKEKRIQFPLISEGKTTEVEVNYLKRQRIKTEPFGRIWTSVVQPDTVNKKEDKGKYRLWFTEGDRRFLVRLEAKVKIGSVTAVLKEVSGGIKP